ncbi:MAG TPA: nitrite reductase small subunit NirD [Pseudonocardiaceae bacterium]|jgi:nitrite reductase (NADH) small subunit|nr:nitrite reductase small subunit NirD [Pseudonocardiaceae bacterium]
MTAVRQAPAELAEGFVAVCPSDRLQPERGVAALLPDGSQAAVIRTYDGQLYAVGNIDPFSSAAVLSRGIVGDRSGVPVVVSPVYKQAFDLRSGSCLDEAGVSVPVYRVREIDGMVWVGAP